MRFLRFVYLFNITPFLTTCQERMGHALSIILQYLKWNRKVNKIQWILNFKTCKKPCRPVELYLAENNLTIFEKTAINSKGEKVTIIFAQSREMQQSTLSIGVDKSGDPRLSNKEQQVFSTENDKPFRNFEPKLKQTGIFVDRFFHNCSYANLAKKLPSVKSAGSIIKR